MKSWKMPITKIEGKCLEASECCVKNAWTTELPTPTYGFAWSNTPYLQNMQVGEIGMRLSAYAINQIYVHVRNGRWIC